MINTAIVVYSKRIDDTSTMFEKYDGYGPRRWVQYNVNPNHLHECDVYGIAMRHGKTARFIDRSMVHGEAWNIDILT